MGQALLDINLLIALLDEGHLLHRPAIRWLAEACSHASHAFWPEPISLLQEGLIRWERLLGPRQITDAYLLALAASQGGCFGSFDQRITLEVVPSAEAHHLCLIPCS
jgi:predicted nucleic acid-binding protein